MGHHRGRREVGDRRGQGLRRLVEQLCRQSRQGPVGARGPSLRRVEFLSHRHGGGAGHRVAERSTRGRPCAPRELLRPRPARAESRSDPTPDPRRGDSLAQRLRADDRERGGERDPARRRLRRASGAGRLRVGVERRGLHRLDGRGRLLRSARRQHRLPRGPGGQPLHRAGVERLRGGAGDPPAPRRQQRPRAALSRRRGHRLHRDVRIAGPRRQRGEVREPRSPSVPRLRLRPDRPAPRLPTPGGGVEPPARSRRGDPHHRRAERHPHRRR